MASLRAFPSRMRALAKRVEDNTNLLVRRTALVAQRELVLETPVDTGRARSNWFVEIGEPYYDELEPYAPGENLGTGEAANARAALAQGQAAVKHRRPGQDIYISNNVRYLQYLNNGSSAQAPEGFIQDAVFRARQFARGHKVLKK